MKKCINLLINPVRSLFLFIVGSFFFAGLHAAPQDVDVTGANPNAAFDFNFSVGAPLPATNIGVLNAGGNVFWEFQSIPPGATGVSSTTFTKNGLTITIPNSSGGSVANTLTASIAGSPIAPGSFSFTVTVSDESNPGANTRNRTYNVIVGQPADIVFVMDRSGSMGANTSAGVTRWEALKDATSNFAALWAALGRSGDRVGLTYFHSSVTQPSVANFPTALISVNNATVANTLSTELNTQNPGGSTGMGLGMKDAQGKVTDATRGRFLILFTDGAQNVPLPTANTNGRGYSDGTNLNPSYPAGAGSIKVFTIGIAGPGGPDLTTLQNLAVENRGNYIGTDDGSLAVAFTDQLANALASTSPQLIAESKTNVASGSGPFTLQSFPLNKGVAKLIIKLTVDRKFEIPQLVQLLAATTIEKDGINVTNRAKPSWAGNYTNTLLLTFAFDSVDTTLAPEGSWAVKINNNVGRLRVNTCEATSIADDHRLDYTFTYGSASPKVNTPLKPSLTLTWLGVPVTDATVQAAILRPGQDLGQFLADNPLKVNVSNSLDAATPGTQKYDSLWAADSAFRNGLAYNENVITLTHTADGKYEGTFDGLTVAGNYQIVYRISGTKPEIGAYQRFATESFYTSFNGIDLAASNVITTIKGKTLVLTFTPLALNKKKVGPGLEKGFAVDNPNIKINSIVDNQDGSYVITFSGSITEPVSLQLMGQEIYKGDLTKIGNSGSFIDKIEDWLKSLGLPGWTIWLLFLLLLILIIWILSKAFKK